jgi:hypothetical protein
VATPRARGCTCVRIGASRLGRIRHMVSRCQKCPRIGSEAPSCSDPKSQAQQVVWSIWPGSVSSLCFRKDECVSVGVRRAGQWYVDLEVPQGSNNDNQNFENRRCHLKIAQCGQLILKAAQRHGSRCLMSHLCNAVVLRQPCLRQTC